MPDRPAESISALNRADELLGERQCYDGTGTTVRPYSEDLVSLPDGTRPLVPLVVVAV